MQYLIRSTTAIKSSSDLLMSDLSLMSIWYLSSKRGERGYFDKKIPNNKQRINDIYPIKQ